MTRTKRQPDPDLTAAQILREAPPAKRAALIRAASEEILELLDVAHNAVGFPKSDGRWDSMLCVSLESVRKRFLHPSRSEENQPA